MIVVEVDLQCARPGVAQDHVGFAEATEIAEGSNLLIQADRAPRGGGRFYNLHGCRTHVAQEPVRHHDILKKASIWGVPKLPSDPLPELWFDRHLVLCAVEDRLHLPGGHTLENR